jgi:hypothetical protein
VCLWTSDRLRQLYLRVRSDLQATTCHANTTVRLCVSCRLTADGQTHVACRRIRTDEKCKWRCSRNTGLQVTNHLQPHVGSGLAAEAQNARSVRATNRSDRDAMPADGYTGTNSTPASATASSRSGAVTTAAKPSPCFQMLAVSVSPGKTTPANLAP